MIFAELDGFGCAFVEKRLMLFIRGDLFAVVHSPKDDSINESDGLQKWLQFLFADIRCGVRLNTHPCFASSIMKRFQCSQPLLHWSRSRLHLLAEAFVERNESNTVFLSLDNSDSSIGRIPFVNTEQLIPAVFSFFIAAILICCTSGYSYINGSVVKHRRSILILYLNLCISASNSSNVFSTSAGSHQSSYDLTSPKRFFCRNA